MTNNNNDDLTGIFDDLTPNDFSTVRNEGSMAFHRFVQENVKSVKIAFMAVDGNPINPLATFANPENEWVFSPNDDENLGQYVDRLRKVAKEIGATWFFISRMTQVATYSVDINDVPKDINGPEALAKASEHGAAVVPGILYYAERLENGVREVQHGIMKINENRLEDPIVGNGLAQSIGLFENILS